MTRSSARPAVLIAGALAAGLISAQAVAQGLSDPKAIDTIIGTEVEEEEARAEADSAKVIAAIEKTAENIETVRKTTVLDKLDIVFLADAAVTEGGPPPEIEKKLEERRDEIAELRKEIEGNAMLYHAVDSREILIRDILALEFDDKSGVVIYAAAARQR